MELKFCILVHRLAPVCNVSDIVGTNGIVFAANLDKSSKRVIENVASKRKNVMPILEDARKTTIVFFNFW